MQKNTTIFCWWSPTLFVSWDKTNRAVQRAAVKSYFFVYINKTASLHGSQVLGIRLKSNSWKKLPQAARSPPSVSQVFFLIFMRRPTPSRAKLDSQVLLFHFYEETYPRATRSAEVKSSFFIFMSKTTPNRAKKSYFFIRIETDYFRATRSAVVKSYFFIFINCEIQIQKINSKNRIQISKYVFRIRISNSTLKFKFNIQIKI